MKLTLSRYPDQPQVRPALKPSRRELASKRYDQEWTTDPAQFDPHNTAHALSRFQLEKKMISQIQASQAVDLGAGIGLHTRILHDQNILVHAVDVSKEALKKLSFLPENQKIQAYIPYTPLEDESFDLVLALDLLGEIPPDEQRLCISEISRLLAPKGKAIISAELDIYSDGPLGKMIYLVETELYIEEIHLFHHGLFIKVCNWFTLMPSLRNCLLKWKGLSTILEKCAKLYQTESDASAVILVASKKKLTEVL